MDEPGKFPHYSTDHIILNDVGNFKRPSGFAAGDLFPGNGGGVLPGINLVGGNAYGGGFGEDAGYIPNGIYNSNPTYTFRDNVNKVFGKHNLQFGAYIAAAQKNELGGELGAGSVPGYLTFDASNTSVSTGNPFADLLLGNISSFGQQDRFVKYYNRYKIVEPYFQDDWRITSRLTLNLGLRLSLYGTYREKQHQAFNFDPAVYSIATAPKIAADGSLVPSPTANPFDGLVQCGGRGGPFPLPSFPSASVGGNPNPGCMRGHLFNPAPRIGFAWDPQGNGKTAIRGGYGIFYEHTNGNEGNTESLENSPPLANAVSQNNIVGYANIGSSTGGFAPQFPLNVNTIPTKAMWPYMQQWHFDIQHEIVRNTVATVSYVGSKGTHLTRQTDLNQLLPLPASQNPYLVNHEAIGPNDCGTTFDSQGVPTAATTPLGVPVTGLAAVHLGVASCGTIADQFRTFQGYGDINHLEPAASSVYHALQLAVRHSVGTLQLNFAYTYSHSIDDSSDRGDASFVDSFNPSANRASSNFDQRHILNFGYVWDIPIFRSPGLANKLLGGWQYSGITTFSTGTPFSVTFPTDNAGVANGVGAGSRADLVGDPHANVSSQPPIAGFGPPLYNEAAFAAPVGLTFGDSGRNILRNPHRINFDMSLFKHFAFTERLSFEFRAEAYNIFNHTEWANLAGDGGSAGAAGNGTNSQGSTGFLYIDAAHNARILQLGAKIIF